MYICDKTRKINRLLTPLLDEINMNYTNLEQEVSTNYHILQNIINNIITIKSKIHVLRITPNYTNYNNMISIYNYELNIINNYIIKTRETCMNTFVR